MTRLALLARFLLGRAVHALLLLLLVGAGTLALIRYAPGYFSDAREMDAQYAVGARAELDARRADDRTALAIARTTFSHLVHGNLGTSRHYHVPVAELLLPCLPVTASLVARSLLLAWAAAFATALPASTLRGRGAKLSLSLLGALGLAVPIGALATVCVALGHGGPVLALALVLAVRDFQFLHRTLATGWRSPHILFARAQGLPAARLLLTHLLRPALGPCAAVLTLSFLAALSMAVPVEVLFDTPGVGQLAWTAAVNRDTPVLLAVTLLLAAVVTAARAFTPAIPARELSDV